MKIFDIITIVTHNEFHSFDGRIMCIQSVRDIDDLRGQFDLVDAGGLGSTHQIAYIVLDFPIRTRHLIQLRIQQICITGNEIFSDIHNTDVCT